MSKANYMLLTPTPILQNNMKTKLDTEKKVAQTPAGTGPKRAGLFARVPAGQVVPQDWCGGLRFSKLATLVNKI
jgi:hypothetical protein